MKKGLESGMSKHHEMKRAICKNDLDKVEELLAQGYNPNEVLDKVT